MAKKANAVEYACSACGRREPKWLGRCPECGEWNSLRESTLEVGRDRAGETFPLPLASIETGRVARIPTGLAADEDGRSPHDAAAQDPVQLGKTRGDSLTVLRIDRREGEMA